MVNMAEVCTENSGLVYYIAKRYLAVCESDRATDIEDLAQSGYIGLIEATQTYDESKGAFSTWATFYIRKEVRKVLGLSRRDQRADQGALSMDAPIGEDITLADAIRSPEDIEADADHTELVQAVRDAVDALPADQRALIVSHDFKGGTFTSAARAYGMVPSTVSSHYHRARRALYQDPKLKALAEAHNLDQRTNWHKHIGLNRYKSTWESSTEALVFWREAQ